MRESTAAATTDRTWQGQRWYWCKNSIDRRKKSSHTHTQNTANFAPSNSKQYYVCNACYGIHSTSKFYLGENLCVRAIFEFFFDFVPSQHIRAATVALPPYLKRLWPKEIHWMVGVCVCAHEVFSLQFMCYQNHNSRTGEDTACALTLSLIPWLWMLYCVRHKCIPILVAWDI